VPKLDSVPKRKCNRGFTLIELLLVVGLIGILAAIAIPSYQDSVRRGVRSAAVNGLMDLANRQEQFYLNNRTYTDSMANLGYTAGLVFDNSGDSAVALDNSGGLVASGSNQRVYFLEIDVADATSYTLQAIPQLSQAADTECGTLGLANTGARTETGTGTATDCW